MWTSVRLWLAALDASPATGYVSPSEARLALAQCGVALTAAEALVLGDVLAAHDGRASRESTFSVPT